MPVLLINCCCFILRFVGIITYDDKIKCARGYSI
jgi:hypothetical protein